MALRECGPLPFLTTRHNSSPILPLVIAAPMGARRGFTMADAGKSISLEEFQRLTQQAGLELPTEDLEGLKPLWELYLQHLSVLHSIDLKAEEIGLTFHPDWPSH